MKSAIIMVPENLAPAIREIREVRKKLNDLVLQHIAPSPHRDAAIALLQQHTYACLAGWLEAGDINMEPYKES
jgi:hypothetical protein